MGTLSKIYKTPMSLLTDLYQLTMAYGYWKTGKSDTTAVFNLFFRHNPYKGGFTLACGLEYILEFLSNFRFTSDDATYLSTLKDTKGQPLFEDAFLDYLLSMEFNCDVDAIPEGTVVFPHEPLIRVSGPVIQAQLIETPLLNMVNFQTLIATKAARIRQACGNAPVMEFGLRRAQGIDGALAASRAAYIGGCDTTSNVEAGKLFGIPLSGTHAHSWVMTFEDEQKAFDAYADAMPGNCVLLVDTFNVEKGIERAIATGKRLQAVGQKLLAIRIDSGDLAYLSRKARQMLDDAGLTDTKIVASNDLDEYIVKSLQEQESSIDMWGIGTKLITAYDQPALGGVYKLAALKDASGTWRPKIKLSEQSLKINIPGRLQVRRFFQSDELRADMIFDESKSPCSECYIIDPMDPTRRKKIFAKDYETTDLLIPVIKKGRQVYTSPDLTEIRKAAMQNVHQLHKSIRRFINPHQYVVGLEYDLYRTRENLILKLREESQ
ncbi:MAG: nicotinate phosphoribosyltransferase [Cyclobacteriaceae bacterium]|nr:nicotinate phosphoribosyltransferase [Cyclobacteriaceae bacterium]